MTHFVGLDVSQKMTAICAVGNAGRRLWRGQCPTVPEQITVLVRRHAGDEARIGIETGAMTPWLVHELRNLGLEVVCLDARHARGAGDMRRAATRTLSVPARPSRQRRFSATAGLSSSTGYGENGFLDLCQSEVPDHIQVEMRQVRKLV
jgi:transposase